MTEGFSFRSLRRKKQELDNAECVSVLKTGMRGVLALHGDGGYPYAVPMNFYYDEVTGHFYFHGAKEGHKIDAIRSDEKVSFCVYDGGTKKDDWAYYVRSVIVFGRMRIVEDSGEIARMVGLIAGKYYPLECADEVRKMLAEDMPHAYALELIPEHMSGKLVHEK